MSVLMRFLRSLKCAWMLVCIGGLLCSSPAVYASTKPAKNNHLVGDLPTQVHPLSGKTILLDAGHGGPDSGARGLGGVQEKKINLSVTMKLARYLQEAGAHVVTTRSTDRDLATDDDRRRRHRHLGDLRGRFRVVRAQSIDAMISVHCNAAPSPAWHGAQTLYFADNDEGKSLAEEMQKSFHSNLLPTNRSIQSNKTLFLLKRVHKPVVLAEVGFITNPEEAKYLQRGAYQERVAFAMYIALTSYFVNRSST